MWPSPRIVQGGPDRARGITRRGRSRNCDIRPAPDAPRTDAICRILETGLKIALRTSLDVEGLFHHGLRGSNNRGQASLRGTGQGRIGGLRAGFAMRVAIEAPTLSACPFRCRGEAGRSRSRRDRLAYRTPWALRCSSILPSANRLEQHRELLPGFETEHIRDDSLPEYNVGLALPLLQNRFDALRTEELPRDEAYS